MTGRFVSKASAGRKRLWIRVNALPEGASGEETVERIHCWHRIFCEPQCLPAGPANRSSKQTVEERSTVAWLRILAKLWWTTSAWILERRLVDLRFGSWNLVARWLKQIASIEQR